MSIEPRIATASATSRSFRSHGSICRFTKEGPRIFARNGWDDSWRNGIYSFTHFHSMIHEVLGVAAGRARVRFGSKAGEELEIEAGDVAVLPAGTGHQRIAASRDFLVVGAYPAQGTYDLCRATPAEHARAKALIPKVPLPDADPVYGSDGPLLKLWRG